MRRIGRTARRWTVAALALASLLLSADRVISDADPGPVAPPTTGPPRELTADEWWTLDRAEALLIAACMRRAGFEFTPPSAPVATPREVPFGNDDVAFARVHGFGFEPDLAALRAASRTDPNQRYFDSLSPKRQAAYLRALNGGRERATSVSLPNGFRVSTSTGGCTAGAQGTLYGDFIRWFKARTLVENLAGVSQPRIAADPRYLAALHAWAGCARSRGYDVGSPGDLRARFGEDPTTPGGGIVGPRHTADPAPEEIRAAVVEAGCAAQTGLVRLAESLDRDFTAEAQREHQGTVDEYRTLALAALERARTVPGAHG
jgi:hypothetical protein